VDTDISEVHSESIFKAKVNRGIVGQLFRVARDVIVYLGIKEKLGLVTSYVTKRGLKF
jgi:hypothetical protein